MTDQKSPVYLAHCGLSPLYHGSGEIMHHLIDVHMKQGGALFSDYYIQEMTKAKTLLAQYLNTEPENMALVRNTTEALSMVANGYPWKTGDEVILYIHEYPANYYPWIIQQNKGVRVRMLKNHMPFDKIPSDLPGKWSWDELVNEVGDRTRMIVMSHVQFVSGYAADLEQLGEFCRERGIDLVVDGAQSLGTLSLDLTKYHISALSGSGWKWLRGPMGIAPFYTSEAMRKKLNLTVVGAETMQQGTDFLNHEWNPHDSARRYEYATTSAYLMAGLNKVLEEVFLEWDGEELVQRLFHLQDHFLDRIDHPDFIPLKWPENHRSGILSIYHPKAADVEIYLRENGIITTARSSYLRVAPHYYNTEEEMAYLADRLNEFEK